MAVSSFTPRFSLLGNTVEMEKPQEKAEMVKEKLNKHHQMKSEGHGQ